jgi:trans-acting transcriptional protein ICP0
MARRKRVVEARLAELAALCVQAAGLRKAAGILEGRYGSSGVPAVAGFRLPIVENEMQPVADGSPSSRGQGRCGRPPPE